MINRQNKAVIYARKTTKASASLKTQVEYCKAWCKSHGYEVQAVYEERVSGTNGHGVQWYFLSERVRLYRDAEYVVAYEQSVISTSSDIVDIRRYLDECKCKLRYAIIDAEQDSPAFRSIEVLNARQYENETYIHSQRVKAGMRTAKNLGIHIGGYRRFCWAEKVDECRGSIRAGGEHPTVIASIPDVMACAGKGMTIGQAAEHYDVSESTLRRNLKDVDKLGEYNSVLRDYRDSVRSAGGESVE